MKKYRQFIFAILMMTMVLGSSQGFARQTQQSTESVFVEGERKQVALTEEGTFIPFEVLKGSSFEFKLYPEFYKEVKQPEELDAETVYPIFAVTKKKNNKDDYRVIERNDGYFTEDIPDEAGDTYYRIGSNIYVSSLSKGTYYLYVAARIPQDVGAVAEVAYYDTSEPMEMGTIIFIFIVIGGICLFILFAMAQRRKKIQEYGSIENWKEEYYKKFVEQNNPSTATNACSHCGNTQHAEGVGFCSKCGYKLK